MTNQTLIILSLITAFLLANLPWISDKFLGMLKMTHKPAWKRWGEWLLSYFLSLSMGFMLEYKLMGTVSSQQWEFYTVTFCLYVIFALPGFIYCYNLKGDLEVQ
ncbi:MAG: DUF2818 family protein [Cycloclasticus sp.]|nr:DUF2818 family protein [Cycloclasticus sp.]